MSQEAKLIWHEQIQDEAYHMAAYNIGLSHITTCLAWHISWCFLSNFIYVSVIRYVGVSGRFCNENVFLLVNNKPDRNLDICHG